MCENFTSVSPSLLRMSYPSHHNLRHVVFSDLFARFPREEVTGEGRRLGTGGTLSGALHTLGYVRKHRRETTALLAAAIAEC
jgi:hypothetical protein